MMRALIVTAGYEGFAHRRIIRWASCLAARRCG